MFKKLILAALLMAAIPFAAEARTRIGVGISLPVFGPYYGYPYYPNYYSYPYAYPYPYPYYPPYPYRTVIVTPAPGYPAPIYSSCHIIT